MKRILFPTDFSNTSANALAYAADLATSLQAELTVLHVYYPNLSGISNTGEYVVVMDQGEDTAKKQLDFFVEEALHGEGNVLASVQLKKELIIGFPAEEISVYAEKVGTDMIVMGTRKEHGLADKFFGSVTTSTLAMAKCPVWVVPAGAIYKGIHNILYASNQHDNELSGLNQCIALAKNNNAVLHYVHINENLNQGYRIQDRLFETISRDEEPEIPFIMTTINSSSVEGGLENYVEENDIDLLVMISAPKTLLERILFQSNTRKMAFRTKVPLLVLRK
ncbi:MAG: universal stress protein [Bacteroidota bacterium]